MQTNTDRLPTLTIAADNFDRDHDFKIGLKNGRTITCRLYQGYKTADDGIYWAMQNPGMIKDHYTEADRNWSARMQTSEPILNGAVVKIGQDFFKIKVLGDYSDAAIFEPADLPRVKLEGKIGGFQ